jgi:hypothetical protein
MSEQAPQVAPKALEAKVAHLGFIQDIINRMASNSFLLKGWAVTLVVAILTLSADSKLQKAIPISYIPVIMFWYLDSFFLRQERLYRCLYSNVASDGGSGHSFSMETQPYSREVPGTLALLLSSTLRVFYVTIILVITAVWQLALR